jgi:voltage-gated potassium channel
VEGLFFLFVGDRMEGRAEMTSGTRQMIYALMGMVLVIVLGTIGFHGLEELSWFDSLWLTMITVLTVGYGDTVPRTLEGRVFALVIIPLSIAIVTYALGVLAALIIEGELSRTFGRRRMERKIKSLHGHVILCGLGRVGQQVLKQLRRDGKQVVVIDRNVMAIEQLPHDLLYVEGDATVDDVLHAAGIERASGLVATLPHDAENVFIALTAKGINRQIKIVGRAERVESEEKLRRAGADMVINPASISGRRMAAAIVKPTSAEYVEMILHDEHVQHSFGEVVMHERSKLLNRTLREGRIRERFGITVVAIRRGKEMISNPHAEEKLCAGDLLILFGERQKIEKFAEAARG